MTFQILISTLNGMFLNRSIIVLSKYILINQSKERLLPNKNNNIYNFNERGLSKSRNRAIEIADADICLISDDDLDYSAEIEQLITDAFKKNSDADIITFQIKTPDGKMYKNYKPNAFWHTKKTLMRVSSVEIAFRLKSIHDGGLKFDEYFGLGAEFPTGEEIIFLTDALKKKLKILYIPIPIVIHPIESSGKNYDNITLIKAKGAMFYRIFGNIGYIISVLFAYKKYKYSIFSLKYFIVLMFKGIKNYRSTQ